MPSPSIEMTCPGKPGQASHFKRHQIHFVRREAWQGATRRALMAWYSSVLLIILAAVALSSVYGPAS
jgi:hypothetical protein